jgi:hypothetical protein
VKYIDVFIITNGKPAAFLKTGKKSVSTKMRMNMLAIAKIICYNAVKTGEHPVIMKQGVPLTPIYVHVEDNL